MNLSTRHSAIYKGSVIHRRYEPVRHQFSYNVFMVFLDLDELSTLFDSYWFWSVGRYNIAQFKRSDHLGDPANDLKQEVYKLVEEKTGHRLEGPVRLLTHLRYWGYCFNPVSFYYCYDATGSRIEAIVAEVNNTPWNEQHTYILTASQNLASHEYQHFVFDKDFHVSPLMSMDMIYDWRLSAPNEKISVHMKNIHQNRKVFSASLCLNREEITGRNLARILIQHPFMTGKIIIAIHWQALKIWLKGATFHVHPKKR